jgi:hypothetical protein
MMGVKMFNKLLGFLTRLFHLKGVASFDLQSLQQDGWVSLNLGIPHNLCESKEATKEFEIGVGVYQGELVTIEELGLSSESHRWVIGKLLYSDLHQIHNDLPQKLLCLAHKLECFQRFLPLLQGSKKISEVKLDSCPLYVQQQLVPLFSSEVVDGIEHGQQLLNKVTGQTQTQRQILLSHPKLKMKMCSQHPCPLLCQNENSNKIGKNNGA